MKEFQLVANRISDIQNLTQQNETVKFKNNKTTITKRNTK